MTDRQTEIEKKHAIVKASGNPYASLYEFGDPDGDDCLAMKKEQEHRYLKKLENPYASLAVLGDSEETPVSVPLPDQTATKLHISSPSKVSKKDFRANCSRIFSQYVPMEEGRKLRPHHRDFITRNENRSGGERGRLLAMLSKYDLSGSGNYLPRFNREKDVLTNAKLQQVERELDLGK